MYHPHTPPAPSEHVLLTLILRLVKNNLLAIEQATSSLSKHTSALLHHPLPYSPNPLHKRNQTGKRTRLNTPIQPTNSHLHNQPATQVATASQAQTTTTSTTVRGCTRSFTHKQYSKQYRLASPTRLAGLTFIVSLHQHSNHQSPFPSHPHPLHLSTGAIKTPNHKSPPAPSQ